MIKVTDILSLEYYKKTSFTGSDGEMRYKIEKNEVEEPDAETGEAIKVKYLLVYTWPGPYAFFQTDDSLKQTAQFPFTNEGLEQVTEYLNSKISEYNK